MCNDYLLRKMIRLNKWIKEISSKKRYFHWMAYLHTIAIMHSIGIHDYPSILPVFVFSRQKYCTFAAVWTMYPEHTI